MRRNGGPAPGKGKAKIVDVARAAGVSPMTVSRVINGSKAVTSQTRARVEEAVASLGYSPNLSARSLASAGVAHIHLLYSNPSESYLSRFLIGSLTHARSAGAQLIVEPCENEKAAAALVQALRGTKAEGLLLPPPLSDCAELLAAIRRSDLPAVAVGGRTMTDDVPTVCIDDEQAAFELTRHIVSLGHRSIGFILGQASQSASGRRLAGYRRALAQAGLQGSGDIIVEGDFSYRSGLVAAERLLRLRQRPTAIFASNDDMAAAAIAVAHRFGLSVPGDLSVCGFDDNEVAGTIWPALTTIHQPVEGMAEAGAALLSEIVEARRDGRRRPMAHRRFDHLLVERGSDGAPPSPERVRSIPSVGLRLVG